MFDKFYPSQKTCLNAIKEGKHSTILWIGSTRVGKSFGVDAALLYTILRHSKQKRYGLKYFLTCGTLGQIDKVHDDNMTALCQFLGMGLSIIRGNSPRYEVEHNEHIFTVYKLSSNDVTSSKRIMGLTLHSGVVDEVTLVPEDFLDRLLTRLSFEDSFIILSGNASSPRNHIKMRYIDNPSSDVLYIESFIDENTDYPEKRKAELRRPGAMSRHLQRQLLDNEWVASDGLIFPFKTEHLNHRPIEKRGGVYVISVDWGLSGTTAGLLAGRYSNGKWHIFDEYYSKGQSLSSNQHVAMMRQKWEPQGAWPPHHAIVDPSAFDMKMAFERFGIPVYDTSNEVMLGLEHTMNQINMGHITIDEICNYLLAEASAYVYDTKTEKPKKENDHACDALRYFAMSEIPLGGPIKVIESKLATGRR